MMPKILSGSKVQRLAPASAGCAHARGVPVHHAGQQRRVYDRSLTCRVAAEDVAASPAPAKAAKAQLADLKVGQALEGTVKSVAAYGCFVDVGAATDGLVHISQLSDGFVKDVNEFVTVGQTVQCKVLSVEGDKRLSLTMKTGEKPAEDRERAPREGGSRRVPRQNRERAQPQHNHKVGDTVTGEVVRIAAFGAFLKLEDGFEVLLHTSEMKTAGELDPNPRDLVKEGQKMEVTVTKVDRGKVGVTNMTMDDRAALKALEKGVTEGADAGNTVGGTFTTLLAGLDLDSLPSMNKGAAPAAVPAAAPEAAAAPAAEEVAAAPAAEEAAAAPEAPAAEAAATPEAPAEAPAAEEAAPEEVPS